MSGDAGSPPFSQRCGEEGALTSVCTMAGRCVRKVFTVWNMSTTPS